MTDAQFLNLVAAAFADSPRPEHFTDHTHCCECAEHDALLCSRDRDTLSLADVGNPGWDPICFITNEGFPYYFPALVRLALEAPSERRAWYMEQLLFHLNDRDKPQKRRPACTPRQKEVVADFLRHVLETRAKLLVEFRMEGELRATIELWSELSGCGPHGATQPESPSDGRGSAM